MSILSFFENCLFPYAITGGRILFYIALTSGAYLFIRGESSSSIKKIKTSTIGYCLLKLIKTYVDMIDAATNGMKFN